MWQIKETQMVHYMCLHYYICVYITAGTSSVPCTVAGLNPGLKGDTLPLFFPTDSLHLR